MQHACCNKLAIDGRWSFSIRSTSSLLDYGNGVMVGLPSYLIWQLQSVRDHITDALISLHWLRVPERVQ